MVNPTPNRSKKWSDLVQFGIIAALVIVANMLFAPFPVQLDLTEEKRYSISPATKSILKNLDDVVYVEVFLEGEFPPGFRRLQNAVHEKLDQFRSYAGGNLQYKFTDPSAVGTDKARNEYYQQLAKKGIQPTNLMAMEGDQRVEKVIFPGAILSVGDEEAPVLLLKGNSMSAPDERLNQSIENMEFELASAIKKLTQKSKKKVAILEGHGELSPIEMADLTLAIQERYEVSRVRLQSKVNLDGYDAVIIAKPDTTFSDPDKFKIDQFIINGGKAMFFVDGMRAELDSIGEKGTYSFPYNLGLDDLFFKYGLRVNPDLIQDMYCGQIPMVTGYVGNQLQTKLVPWRYYPVLSSFSKHPVAKNMDMIYVKFGSSLDTVKAQGIRKTPLVSTSQYSRIMPSPVRLNFNEARIDVNPKLFSKGSLPIGYLLEGKFESLFTNRLAPETVKVFKFKAQDKPSRVVVFSDGDLVRNDIDRKNQQPMELGYDRFMRVKFANKELVMNALGYLLDEDGLLMVRGKEVTLRPLDRVRIKEEKWKWQALNIGLPLLLLGIYGITRYYLRKKKFTRFPVTR